MIHLDTHVVVWLHNGDLGRLSGGVIAVLEDSALTVSPMVELELEYLYEIGRISQRGAPVLAALADRIGLEISLAPFASVVRQAVGLRWTRDPFDRMIVAAALAEDAPLLTKDVNILKNVPSAFWP